MGDEFGPENMVDVMLQGMSYKNELWVNMASLLTILQSMTEVWRGQVVTAETVTEHLIECLKVWEMEWDAAHPDVAPPEDLKDLLRKLFGEE